MREGVSGDVILPTLSPIAEFYERTSPFIVGGA
jgi:hypothetical protein